MNYTLTLRAEERDLLHASVFSVPSLEGAAFLLCGVSRSENEIRLLGREVIPVAAEDYLRREPDFLSLSSPCYVSVAKRAREHGWSVVFVHSHPGGLLEFSEQDDREDPKLQEFLAARAPDTVHGSLVMTYTGMIGRVWQGGFQPMARVRVIGDRFEFHDRGGVSGDALRYFDRQVRAFGPEIQAILQRLHVGVVGAGGTGSAVIEQLTRLGVGTISVFDRDTFDESNVNRLYGSSANDQGQPKVDLARRNVTSIGLGTSLLSYPEHINREVVARRLRECDLIFGCTDKEGPRAILVQLALRYLIPIFDLGVVIDSSGGTIRGVVGRVTTLLPGEACLFCRRRITPEAIELESLTPEQRGARAREGYAPELETNAPAVIPFTTSVAATAISELIHRLTGYMGQERRSSEVLHFFDKSKVATNRTPADDACLCAQRRLWGRGDTRRFLELFWSS